MGRSKRGRPLHGLLLLDKPTGISSNKALQQAKRLFDARKAGHTGSLDPLATGMLPICFGEATKLSQYLLNSDKGYLAEIQLGVRTDSADSDGDIIDTQPVPADLDISQIDAVCEAFRGPQMQVPPMVSAIKIDGQRLYKLAREGVTVDRPPRSVVIHDLQVQAYKDGVITVSVNCSKGTYIRSLATDLGDALGCGAHIRLLRRTHVSPFEAQAMYSLEDLEQRSNPDELLLPLDAGMLHLPLVRLADANIEAFQQGRQVAAGMPEELGQLSQDTTLAVSGDLSHPGPSQQGPAVPGPSIPGPAVPGPSNRGPAQQDPDLPIRVYSEAGILLGLARVAELGVIAPFKVIQWD